MSAAEVSSSEEEFGQETPPLTQFIQTILARYPDGSQLFELLQNADDAKATRVRFIWDARTHQCGGTPLSNASSPKSTDKNVGGDDSNDKEIKDKRERDRERDRESDCKGGERRGGTERINGKR